MIEGVRPPDPNAGCGKPCAASATWESSGGAGRPSQERKAGFQLRRGTPPRPEQAEHSTRPCAAPLGEARPGVILEPGGSTPRSVRFPDATWALLERRAKARGLTLHAALREAIWLGRAALPDESCSLGPTIRERLLREASVTHLPFRDRTQARLNGLLIQPAPHGFMLKLSPEGEGFNSPKGGQ